MKIRNNKIIRQMGSECARSFQTDRHPWLLSQMQNKQKATPVSQNPMYLFDNTSMVTAFVDNKDQQVDAQNRPVQKHLSHSKILNQFNQNAKFVPNVGFVDQNYNSSNYVNFGLKTDFGKTFRLELEGPEQEKLNVNKRITITGQYIDSDQQIYFGNTILKLRFILDNKQVKIEKKYSETTLPKCTDPSAQCRFCLQPCTRPSNPLVMPCKCQGSINAVHQKCLSEWIFGHTQPFEPHMSAFKFVVKNSQCEICKYSFQDYVWNRMMTVFSVFQANFGIFEYKNLDESPGFHQSIHKQFVILKFQQKSKPIKIGTSQNCDFKLTDPSISGEHLNILLSNGRIYVQDLGSKLGTYLKYEKRQFEFGVQYRVGSVYFKLKQVKEVKQLPDRRKNQSMRF